MPDRANLDSVYDPESFRATGHQLVDALADSLRQSLDGKGNPIQAQDPESAAAYWQHALESALSDDKRKPDQAMQWFQEWIHCSIKTHHPRTMGHQVGVSAPIAALADLLGSLLDTGNGVFEVGNPATAIERAVVLDLARRLHLDKGAGGFLTSGGTLGNLTAMLAARQAAAPFDAWKDGNTAGCPLGVLVSDEAHYCIDRAARVMGWGARGVVRVATDEHSRMRAPAMETALAKARAAGIHVIAAVGNACSTATGAFDPLDEIGAFCEKHRLWFHVDAAHGGAVVFSDQHRHLLNGIERADSIVIDFHKLLLTPSLTTAVLFREEATSFGAFAQQADYLWRETSAETPSTPWFDAARRAMECTRPMAALRVFALLATHGASALGDTVDTVFAAARTFARLITTAPDFELLCIPTANIVCYRLAPPDASPVTCDALNTSARVRLIENGNFYIVETKIGGRTWLRSAIMNPFTAETHCKGLLQELREIGAALRENDRAAR